MAHLALTGAEEALHVYTCRGTYGAVEHGHRDVAAVHRRGVVHSYLSMAVVVAVRRRMGWLPDDLNRSRLDSVYWVLALVAAMNFSCKSSRPSDVRAWLAGTGVAAATSHKNRKTRQPWRRTAGCALWAGPLLPPRALASSSSGQGCVLRPRAPSGGGRAFLRVLRPAAEPHVRLPPVELSSRRSAGSAGAAPPWLRNRPGCCWVEVQRVKGGALGELVTVGLARTARMR